MSPLESLAPDQRAVVALVLQQGRSYDEIAALLGIPVDAVRARAHAGLAALAPGQRPAGRDHRRRSRTTCWASSRAGDAEATRGLLAESAPARAWATGVAERLADVAPGPLPEIPRATTPRRRRPTPRQRARGPAAAPRPAPRRPRRARGRCARPSRAGRRRAARLVEARRRAADRRRASRSSASSSSSCCAAATTRAASRTRRAPTPTATATPSATPRRRSPTRSRCARRPAARRRAR